MSPAQSFDIQMDNATAQMRVALPGTITSFNASTQRVSVRPGVKMKLFIDGKVQYLELPILNNVPICLPMGFGAGVFITYPISSGDPCLLIFADRAIDNFMQSGAPSTPGSVEDDDITVPRAHHLTDAICIPGLIAEPQAIENYSSTAIELRDQARQNFISFDKTTGITLQTAGLPIVINTSGGGRATAPLTLIGSNMAIDGRPGSSPSAPMTITNGLKSTNGTFIDKNGRDSSGHIHSGVQGGNQNTGPTAG
jgi:hypothetical protein